MDSCSPCLQMSLLGNEVLRTGTASQGGGLLLAKERPGVVLITGVGSVAADDVRAQLREAEGDYDLDVVRVSMHQPGDVARAFRAAADADGIALTRGGGQTVHDLDHDDLISAVAS